MAGAFNIADLFEALADAIGDRTALVSGARRLTFAELDRRADRVAAMLRSRGIGAGAHVGLHLYNGAEYVELMLGAFKLRAVPINLNYRYVAAELRHLCKDADLAMVVTQRDLLPVVHDAVTDQTVMTVEGEYEAALAEVAPRRDYGTRSGDDRYIIYTGGTTGMPKGVLWRQEDLFFGGLQGGRPGGAPVTSVEEVVEFAKDPDNAMRMLPAAPLIHGAAQLAAWIGLFTGGQLTLQPGRSFDAVRVAELIDEEQVGTITIVGDAMARPLCDALGAKRYDMSSLGVIASAGAILSPAVRERLQELLPDTLILNNFGASETGHQGAAFPGSDVGTDGRPSFSMDRRSVVLDEDQRPLPPGSGKIGILACGGYVPLGYYNDPKKTAERFITIDGKRYVIVGDLATVEADGRITVYGRGVNCINTGGEKVFPEEVEEVLKAHPDVFDALVVGVADERWMQRVAAVVALRPGRSATVDDLQAHCRLSLAGYKIPRQISFAPEVLRQPSGKPDYAWARRVAEGDR